LYLSFFIITSSFFFSTFFSCLFFFFFFECYGHHRDLHSFPTRRSSDLVTARQCIERFPLLFRSHLRLLLYKDRCHFCYRSDTTATSRDVRLARYNLRDAHSLLFPHSQRLNHSPLILQTATDP